MRTGSLQADGAAQGRLWTMDMLRPYSWMHARDGVVDINGTGRLTSINCKCDVQFLYETNGLTRVLSSQGPRIEGSPTDYLKAQQGSVFFESFTLGVVWQVTNNQAVFNVRDSLFSDLCAISAAPTSSKITATIYTTSFDQAYTGTGPTIATLSYNAFTQTGRFAVNGVGNSVSASSNSDYFESRLTCSTNNGIYEAVFFNRFLGLRESQILEGILAWSNGFGSLLTSHPFSSRPPMRGD